MNACPIKQEGDIEILLDEDGVHMDTGGHLLVVRTSKLFVPYEEGINEDKRSLGIAVLLDHIKII
ncbi:MAG: hypothetical protein K2N87_11230 [Eubacterium sp.]|nr:hypothetical protein [Eubacterium sp.]